MRAAMAPAFQSQRLKSTIRRVIAAVSVGLAQNVTAHAVPHTGPQSGVVKTIDFDIKSQPMEAALTALGAQSGLTIIVETKVSRGVTAAALSGPYTADEALKRLLEPAGLRAEYLDSTTVAARAADDTDRRGSTDCSLPESKADPFCSAASSTLKPAGGQEEDQLLNIIVTATRQSQRLSEVPISVVAINQEAMDKQGIRSVEDLMRSTPSVKFGQSSISSGTGQSVIAIRGIESTSGVPTTGVYIDDTPIQTRVGLSQSLGNAYPELFDLDRVEVLRGPQGTLFGAGSVGGAVRFITPEPSLDRSTLYTRSEISSIENGGTNWEQGVAGSMPIIDGKLGIRASVWHRNDGGYIDRLDRVTKERVAKDINGEVKDALRLSLKWQATDNLTILPSVFGQRTDTRDSSRYELASSNPSKAEFNTSLAATRQGHWDRFILPALKVTFDFDRVTLISNTSYLDRRTHTEADGAVDSIVNYGLYSGAGFPEGYEDYMAQTFSQTSQKGLTQEVRLQSSDPDVRLNWVAGLFFQKVVTRESTDLADPQMLRAINLGLTTLGEPPATSIADVWGVDLYRDLYSIYYRLRYEDLDRSLFAQADYEIVPKLKATLGLRYSWTKFSHQSFGAGPLFGTNPDGLSHFFNASRRPLTPKFGLSYQADDNNLFYSSVAKGMRGSGVHEPDGAVCAEDGAAIGFDPLVSREIKPDSLWSYEIGSKNRLFDGRLGIDFAAYHIDWRNMQTMITLPICQSFTTLNLGNASSDGADLTLAVQPASGLSLELSASYIDVRYTSNLYGPQDTVIRRAGELIDMAPWSFHFGGEYEFALGSRDWYARADYTHTTRNNKPLDLSSPLVDPDLPRGPTTSQLDLRAGARFSAWDASLFVANVLDNRPVLALGHPGQGSLNFTSATFRQRTIGITLTYRR